MKRSSGLTGSPLLSCNGTSQDGSYLMKPHLITHNLCFLSLLLF